MTSYDKQYYEANKERYKQTQLKWNKRNPDKLLEFSQRYANDNPKKTLLGSSKQRAKRCEIEFSLQEEDLIIPDVCPYLGIPLTSIRGKGRQQTNLSLDRIDSTKGYVPGNVQVISDLANRMKQEATPEQLVAFAKGILNMYKE